MWSKVSTNSTNFQSIKFTTSQNGMIFSMLSILKMLRFFPVAEALTGLIYHRPTHQNSSFLSCLQSEGGFCRNVTVTIGKGASNQNYTVRTSYLM